MHFPVELAIGNYKVSAHLISETLAFVLGYRYYKYLRNRSIDPIDDSNRLWIVIGATFGAFVFSRLVGALEDPIAWLHNPHPFLYLFSNKTITGGLVGGLLGVEFTKYLIGEKNSSGDLFTLPLILAIMIGRIGCFSSGVYEPTYGTETQLPWGMDLGDHVLRHPVALYEIVFLGILWCILKPLKQKYHLYNGLIFKLFMISYFSFRLGIEWIKPSSKYYGGFSVIQCVSIWVLLYYIKTIYLIFTKSKTLQTHEQH